MCATVPLLDPAPLPVTVILYICISPCNLLFRVSCLVTTIACLLALHLNLIFTTLYCTLRRRRRGASTVPGNDDEVHHDDDDDDDDNDDDDDDGVVNHVVTRHVTYRVT